MFNALHSREGTNKTKRKICLTHCLYSLKNYLNFPLPAKYVTAASTMPAAISTERHIITTTSMPMVAFTKAASIIWANIITPLTARRPTMSAAPICTAASMAAGSSITSATVPTSGSMSTISRAVTMASISISHPARTAEIPLTIFFSWK